MATQLLTPALTVFEQMAVDEVLAHQEQEGSFLRFYHWMTGPAVTFYYSQFFSSVRGQISPDRGPLCRRPTGGGIVYHGSDLTFSLICESIARPGEIYARLHGAIEQALAQGQLMQSTLQGAVSAEKYAPAHNGIASGCFANPVQDDLMANGQKILGGAIRRFCTRILYQGSLQCPQARTNPLFRRAVMQGVASFLGTDFKTVAISTELLQKARELAVSQYQTREWTEKFL